MEQKRLSMVEKFKSLEDEKKFKRYLDDPLFKHSDAPF